MTDRVVDVVIVGAGLSGIGAAVHLRTKTALSFVILEARAQSGSFGLLGFACALFLSAFRRTTWPGGTWDLFRYPGVRSDSDMFTLGYSFQCGDRSFFSKRDTRLCDLTF